MTPERTKTIGSIEIKEYYWAGEMVVYVNNRLTKETFDNAAAMAATDQEIALVPL